MPDLNITLPNGVLMALGTLIFETGELEFNKLDNSYKWRWAKRNRMGRKPAQQYQGPDLDSISLPITVFPKKADDLKRFDEIVELANTGEPQRLIGPSPKGGKNMGLWVIKSLSKTSEYLTDRGAPLYIHGTLVIEEYGDDKY